MSAPHDSVSSPVASTLSLEALTQLLEKVFLRHGTSASVAQTLAANCAGAERDGAHSHGVFRIPVMSRHSIAVGSMDRLCRKSRT